MSASKAAEWLAGYLSGFAGPLGSSEKHLSTLPDAVNVIKLDGKFGVALVLERGYTDRNEAQRGAEAAKSGLKKILGELADTERG